MVALAAVALSGCSYLPSLPDFPSLPNLRDGESFLGLITPYRIDIVQGNVVTKEQADAVKPGMTRAQVRDILGSPMLTDAFHADRWDYIFTIRRPGTPAQRRSVVARFTGDKLDSLEGGDLPAERDFVASITRALPNRTPGPLELTEAQRQALPKPAPVTEPPATPMGAVRTYPPLEPS